MSRVQPSPQTRFTRDGPSGVITDLQRGVYFGVNELGCEIWTALLAGVDCDVLVDDLARRFGVEQTTVRRDLDDFLDFLRAEHLVTQLQP